MLFTKDKSFYKNLFLLALPIALQNFVTFSVNLADSVMVGSLGDAAVGGLYMGNQIQTLLQVFSGGIECAKYKTALGGNILAGIHQPHPVATGKGLMATPEGRACGAPVAVTLTPESGTMKNGPTAALASASKIDPSLVHWNYCVMVNYFASVFKGNNGKEIFKNLLNGYFKSGGLQHQPNISDVEELRKAQLEPEKYKDLIVRLWGVSAHFVDLPKELQDEMIARFE